MNAAASPTERTGATATAVPDTELVIETIDLTKVYPGDVQAVDRLNLTVHRGEIFGLLGPNGAGKTTTAGMLTTRVRAHRGPGAAWAASTCGRTRRGPSRSSASCPQSNTLDRSLNVWENLYFHGRFFGMSAQGRPRPSRDRLLEQFRLTERADADVLALSGGMAQRLMVARAVMHRPSVLFLDEPTAGLDPQSRIALWEILGELHTDGQTILLTTHYMEEADQLCDRLAIIDHGSMLALDTPADLKASTGVDTIVTISAEGDLDVARRACCATGIPGATDGQRRRRRPRPARRQGRQGRAARRGAARRRPRPHRHRPVDQRADARDRVHQDDGEGPPRMTTTAAPPAADPADRHRPRRPSPARGAFKALLLRDVYVLRRNLSQFIPRTVLQPLLLVFVFTYVFPKIGQGIGGDVGRAFSTMLIAGVLASVILFQGIQAVALPLVQEFGYTREIEDRVLAPLPVELVAFEKVVVGRAAVPARRADRVPDRQVRPGHAGATSPTTGRC